MLVNDEKNLKAIDEISIIDIWIIVIIIIIIVLFWIMIIIAFEICIIIARTIHTIEGIFIDNVWFAGDGVIAHSGKCFKSNIQTPNVLIEMSCIVMAITFINMPGLIMSLMFILRYSNTIAFGG